MASIWIEWSNQLKDVPKHSRKPRKVKGNLSALAAGMEMTRYLLAWEEAKGRTWKAIDAHTWFLYDRKLLVGSLYIEPLSPSSKPAKGDVYREAAKK
jgi:hypothetical protein